MNLYSVQFDGFEPITLGATTRHKAISLVKAYWKHLGWNRFILVSITKIGGDS